MDSIRGTVAALAPQLELSRVFGGLQPGPPYTLRCTQRAAQHAAPVHVDLYLLLLHILNADYLLMLPGSPTFRSIVCYFGHHYEAYVLSEELDMWLLFDDHVIVTVGDWQQVQAAMVAGRRQPSLLFYEAPA